MTTPSPFARRDLAVPQRRAVIASARGMAALAVGLLVATGADPAGAQGAEDWTQTPTAHFIILAPPDAGPARDHYASRADGVYTALTTVFSTTLETPITLRLFTSDEAYRQSNPLAALVDGAMAGGRRGRREIALALSPTTAGGGSASGAPVGSIDGAPPSAGTDIALDNVLRRELAYRFAGELSGDRLPDGFREGVAQYLEQPDDRRAPGVARLRDAWQGDRLATWADLNAPGALYGNGALVMAQGRSIVAFLVDTHGWAKLLGFIRATAAAPGWRNALEAVYDRPPVVMEDAWRAWLPDYLDGGWRGHALYSRDFLGAESLLAKGDFAGAQAQLAGAESVLAGVDPDAADRAQGLLARAEAGLAARAALAEAESALEAGDYPAALAQAERIGADLRAAGDGDGAERAGEIARRARIGRDAAEALGRAERLPPWRVLGARDAAYEAAVAFAMVGNDVGAERARSRMTALDRRLAPAGWSLFALGTALLGWNARRRWLERRR